MKKIAKVGIALAAVVLGLIVSPAVALNEVDAAKKSVEYIEKPSTSGVVKNVKIVGLDEISFAPNTLNIKQGDTVVFTNVDGSKGGTDHAVVSVKIGTIEPDAAFKSGILRVGETFKVTFEQPGVYEYLDILHPTTPGRITVT